MSFSHEVIDSVNAGDGEIRKSNSYTGTKRISASETVPPASTDFEIVLPIVVADVVSFMIVTSADMTIETNNGTTPDDTLSLLAGVAYKWNSDSYDTFKLTTDVTSIFVTSTPGGTIQVESLEDATP